MENEEYDERTDRLVQAYLHQLSNDEAPYRWGAAEALGRLEDPRAVDLLMERLEDPDWRVREKAAWALGRIGDPRAVPKLNRLMRDEREVVQDTAREAIQEIRQRLIAATRRERGDRE
jgi:HEAT repeat protein